ncbi:E3 ubiquitin-protein ligase MIB2 [Eumeta japonica]|uniref:RING-type E3 ubiquitin transferase n=1 Tax=Eumeta variegata TaxID=151549 RepID=A0A4C1WZF8_EUMVA|nr:E3 ubiquitin-protein ligase MIB2 [Eumeta japonica]
MELEGGHRNSVIKRRNPIEFGLVEVILLWCVWMRVNLSCAHKRHDEMVVLGVWVQYVKSVCPGQKGLLTRRLSYTTATGPGIYLTQRSAESKLCVKGIFSGAIVKRGHNWKWDNQDGGAGKTGTVTEICNWGTESQRSVACVTWHNGYKNDYRVGHKGIMDLEYVTPAIGGYYYINHLPILGKKEETTLPAHDIRQHDNSTSMKFYPGERVKVVLNAEILKSVQQGHGGWNPRMAEYIGKVGFVHRITDRGDVRVQYEDCSNRWTFHPGTLERLGGTRVGDLVRVLSDLETVRGLQTQYAEWLPTMEQILGKMGKVINVFQNGNLRVQISEYEHQSVWTLYPQCVKRIEDTNASTIQSTAHSIEQSQSQTEQTLTKDQPELRLLMIKVAQGNLEYVKEIQESNPSLLDMPYGGKTALQVAAYRGHTNVVSVLLAGGAAASARDLDGDTALHDAAFGNQPENLKLEGLKRDARTKKRRIRNAAPIKWEYVVGEYVQAKEVYKRVVSEAQIIS